MQFLHVKTSLHFLHFLHEPMFYQVKYFQNFNPIFLGFFWGGGPKKILPLFFLGFFLGGVQKKFYPFFFRFLGGGQKKILPLFFLGF